MNLPNELLALILLYTPPSTRVCLRLTCRRMRKMVDNDVVRWLRATGVEQPIDDSPVRVHTREQFLDLLTTAWHQRLMRIYELTEVTSSSTIGALLASARAHPGPFMQAMADIPEEAYGGRHMALAFAIRLHATGQTITDWNALVRVGSAVRPECAADLDTCIDYVSLSRMHGACNLVAMRNVVRAFRAGAKPLVCPVDVDGTDAQWGMTMHYAYIDHHNRGGLPLSWSRFIAQHESSIALSNINLLRLRASKPIDYCQNLRAWNIWHIPYNKLEERLYERKKIGSKLDMRSSIYSRQYDTTSMTLVQAVERLLRDGVSERLRPSMEAARAAGACRPLEQLLADMRRSATLMHLVDRVRVYPTFLQHHPTAELALADAQMMLRVVAPPDEFAALIRAGRRKRAHSPERGSRRVRARTEEPLP